MTGAPLPIGIGLPVVQQVPGRARAWEAEAGPEAVLQVARAADRLGFAWLACSDHIAIPAAAIRRMGATWYEPLTTLAFVAAATTRIRLLAHVLVLPYRHPLLAAKLAATVDQLSGGRLIVGTGSGHLRPEFQALGVDAAQRGAMTEEYLQALAVALGSEMSSFTGRFVQWQAMTVAPRPVQQPHPPLWVGGNTVAMARRAGRFADGWIPWQIAPEAFAERAAQARAAHRDSGRTTPFIAVAPLHAGRVDEPAALRESLARWRDAGADAIHLGLEHDSVDDYVALLERVAAASAL